MISTYTDDYFLLPGLDAYQQARTERIATLLGSGLDTANPAGRPIAYAVAHHLLEGAEQAARDRDEALLGWYRRTSTRDLAYLLAAGPPGSAHLVLNPTQADLLRSPLSETAYYLVRPETAPAEGPVLKILAAALDSAHEHGLGRLVEQQAPIVCLLEHRDLAHTLFSWSITSLPGTVFTDFTDHPEVLARDLIHEAGHHWLNEALALTETVLPDDVTFYSPWRATERPVFGFLHACWAFSLTVIYSARALAMGASPVCDFLAADVSSQQEQLEAANDSFSKAIGYIKAEALKGCLTTVIRTALET